MPDKLLRTFGVFFKQLCKVLTWISVFLPVEHDEKQFNHFSPMLDFIYEQRKSNYWFLYDMQNEMKWVNLLPCFFLWFRTKVFFSTALKVTVLWSFSLPYFPVFGLNKEIYKVNLRIQSKRGKIQTPKTTKTPNTNNFHKVKVMHWTENKTFI